MNKLEKVRDNLEEVKEVAGVLIACITIAAFVHKRWPDNAEVQENDK